MANLNCSNASHLKNCGKLCENPKIYLLKKTLALVTQNFVISKLFLLIIICNISKLFYYK